MEPILTAAKVLVIDSDTDITAVVKEVMQQHAYKVFELSTYTDDDIKQAIELCTPDIILLEFFKKNLKHLIQVIKDYTNARIFLFSTQPQLEKHCKELELCGFIPKPFEIEEMFAVLARL